ncbi:MAG: SAM-dependent methyltransferase [Acidobacteriota bacterium]|jgi:hypothetical protein|nr:SAM-dependent methyltransferase [Acidobacteriota bacterium]
MASSGNTEYSSFRDPSGRVFERNGVIYRQVNPVYLPHYEHLIGSGLYEDLVRADLLVPHDEVGECDAPGGRGKVIRPEQIPYISYPYEWCFEQYQDAALATLRAQRLALRHGMTLKDASAYNVQFRCGKAVLIDTLSFEDYTEGPWTAYGQFCRHFFAPLLLMAHLDARLGKMMQEYIDGVPLDLASTLLGRKGGLAAWQHIRLHAASIRRFGETSGNGRVKPVALKKERLAAIVESLIRNVEGLKPKEKVTEWGDYYRGTNYSDASAEVKKALIAGFLGKMGSIGCAWDLGANDGRYSRLAIGDGTSVVAFDIDSMAVSRNWRDVKRSGENLLPLLLDLAAPSPAIGFANRERKTIDERRKPDVTLMLALVHHLAISNNLPLGMIAEWVASFTKFLVIEFVPKGDSQVQRLLRTRADIFPGYTEEHFEQAFAAHFTLLEKKPIEGTVRTLYLFRT